MDSIESIRYPRHKFGESTGLKSLAIRPIDQILPEADLTSEECLVYLVVRLWLENLTVEDEVYIDAEGTIWGKLPGYLLGERLKKQFGVTLNDRRLQRRLSALTEKGLLMRAQHAIRRYDRAFFYRLPVNYK
jgi:hypothetical protein